MTPPADLGEWPPTGSAEVDVDDAFRAWHRGDELFVELRPSDESVGYGFAAHLALMDAALHLHLLTRSEDHETLAPYAWRGVALHEPGAFASRVHFASAEDGGSSVTVADQSGLPVLSVRSLESRPISPDQLATADRARAGSLLRLDWIPALTAPVPAGHRQAMLGEDPYPDLTALTIAAEVPEYVLADPATVPDTLALVQAWLAADLPSTSTLVVLTRHAVRIADDAVYLDRAPIWGLMRSVQAEHPDRFVLVDLDDSAESLHAVPAALTTGEAEIGIRSGTVLLPRLAQAGLATGSPEFPPEGTFLITAGTEGAGALLARHLVTARGVRHLLLTGEHRADDLVKELTALGAEIDTAQCDVADRAALAELIAGIPAEHPLTGVLHIESLTDSALVDALTAERFSALVQPQLDAAWNLHELTLDRHLSAFVLVSSSVELIHGLGQANLAAASSYLDGLAGHRRTLGLSATALAYGPWEVSGDAPGEAYRERMGLLGIPSLTAEEGLALFDAALALDEPLLMPILLDQRVLRGRPDDLPMLLRGVVRLPAQRRTRAGKGRELRERLSGLPGQERERVLLELVRTTVASVLGHRSADAIEPDRAFQELGFDSLAAVDLRKRLSSSIRVPLAATLVFDHPNSRAVAAYLDATIAPAEQGAASTVLDELERLDRALSEASSADGEHDLVTSRLEALVRRWRDARPGAVEQAGIDLGSATDDELFEAVNKELGIT
jgi:hypothetical protein